MEEQEGKILWNYGEKPEKVTTEEWIVISTFFLAMVITLSFVISMFVAFFIFGAYYMIKQAVLFSYRKPKRFYKILSFWGKILIVLFIVLFFTDATLTYISVHKLQFAVEGNPFAVWLWETFGYFFGECIRVLIFICAIFYPLWILISARNGEKRIFVAFVFSLIAFLLYGFVVIHNLILLLHYLCWG